MANFFEAYNLTSANEGGYVNDPNDNGGETYCGISRKSFPKWSGWSLVDKNKPLKTGQILKITSLHDAVLLFYKVNFWDKLGGDKLGDQDLANQVYDMAVNAGVNSALNLLKQV